MYMRLSASQAVILLLMCMIHLLQGQHRLTDSCAQADQHSEKQNDQ